MRLVQSWVRFWFVPVDPIGLHMVRLLAGLLFICWLLPFANNVEAMFGLDGWFDREALQDTQSLLVQSGYPLRLGWSILYACGNNATVLLALYWLSLVVLVLFAAGIWTRVTAVLTWLVVVSFTENPGIESDADILLRILAFYLMIGFLLLGQDSRHVTWAERLRGLSVTWPFGGAAAARQPSAGATMALRLLQIHLAVVMVATGLHKLQFGDWWSGLALWYLVVPPFETTAESFAAIRQHAGIYLFSLNLATYAVLGWQIGFPVFAWRPRLARVVLLGGALIGWLGTAAYYRLPLFGPAVLVGCLSYVSADEWHGFRSFLTRMLHLTGLVPYPPVATEPRSPSGKKKDSGVTSITREPR